MADGAHNDDFWNFTLNAYRGHGVQPGVIHLQDTYDADVNVLFLCCYAAVQQLGTLDATDFEQADAALNPWKSEVTLKLRTMRDRIRSDGDLWSLPGASDTRGKVLAAEIDSERVAQIILERTLRARADRPTSGTPLDDAIASLDGYLDYLKSSLDERGRTAILNLLKAAVPGDTTSIEASWRL